MEGIIDTGGSNTLMPLKVALHSFRILVEQITEMVELVQPDRKVDDETVQRIRDHARPATVKQLMQFNGLVNL